MDLKEIMSVSGQGGLFKFVSQGRNGIIVESFTDKKRVFINATQKVSSLGDIAIFTDGEDVPLQEVFKSIHEASPGVPAIDPKSSPEVLKQFMEKILPSYDRERVYVSDIKKLVSWYNTLLELNLLNFEEMPKPDESKPEETTQAEKKESGQEPAPKKSTANKKSPANKKASSGKK